MLGVLNLIGREKVSLSLYRQKWIILKAKERERDECTTWFLLRIYIKKWGLTLVGKKKLFINITTILNESYRILLYLVNILLIFKIPNLI